MSRRHHRTNSAIGGLEEQHYRSGQGAESRKHGRRQDGGISQAGYIHRIGYEAQRELRRLEGRWDMQDDVLARQDNGPRAF